jgi:hypothetical protein
MWYTHVTLTASIRRAVKDAVCHVGGQGNPICLVVRWMISDWVGRYLSFRRSKFISPNRVRFKYRVVDKVKCSNSKDCRVLRSRYCFGLGTRCWVGTHHIDAYSQTYTSLTNLSVHFRSRCYLPHLCIGN